MASNGVAPAPEKENPNYNQSSANAGSEIVVDDKAKSPAPVMQKIVATPTGLGLIAFATGIVPCASASVSLLTTQISSSSACTDCKPEAYRTRTPWSVCWSSWVDSVNSLLESWSSSIKTLYVQRSHVTWA